jgi:hypothetical protein
MKTKVLLVPFLLVLGIVLIVWSVLPSYYDDKSKREELKNENNRLDEVRKKVEMSSKLMNDLATKADKQEVLFSFLPEKQEEEEAINDLNNIASMEGVSIKNLTTVKAPASGLKTSSDNSSKEEGSFKNQSMSFYMDFTLIGEYGKIRNVINRLNNLKRFNKTSSLTISKVVGEEEIAGNNLQAKIILAFYYLKKADAVNISSSIFNKETFDMSPVEKINNLRTMNVLKIGSVPSGRDNPFLQ